MRLGVISDTHDHAANTMAAVEMLRALKVERVLHCGDIGSPTIVKLLAEWPTDYVLGNIESHREQLAQSIVEAGNVFHGMFGDLKIAGKRVALLHSHDRRKFQEVTQSGEWDLVCYGHTHKAQIDTIGSTVVLNPGALYRANPHSIAIVKMPELEASIITL